MIAERRLGALLEDFTAEALRTPRTPDLSASLGQSLADGDLRLGYCYYFADFYRWNLRRSQSFS